MVNLARELQLDCFSGCEGPAWIEYRHIGIDRPAIQEFHRIDQAKPFQKDDYNLYFGVLPRSSNKLPMDHTHWLWGDFDNREDFLFTAVKDFKAEPTVVVDSGRGFQVYWKLAIPMPTDMASVVMKGIAKMHNGDHTHDAARILRLPGTINRKNGAVARVLGYNPNIIHPWADFIDYAEEGRSKPRPRWAVHTDYKVDDLPNWLATLITSDPGKGMRSEHAYRVVCALIEHGYEFEDIEFIFEAHPDGVGAKYYEKGRNGTSWLRTTFDNASRNI